MDAEKENAFKKMLVCAGDDELYNLFDLIIEEMNKRKEVKNGQREDRKGD